MDKFTVIQELPDNKGYVLSPKHLQYMLDQAFDLNQNVEIHTAINAFMTNFEGQKLPPKILNVVKVAEPLVPIKITKTKTHITGDMLGTYMAIFGIQTCATRLLMHITEMMIMQNDAALDNLQINEGPEKYIQSLDRMAHYSAEMYKLVEQYATMFHKMIMQTTADSIKLNILLKDAIGKAEGNNSDEEDD